MPAKKGTLFVISAPSGSGKTTLCQKLLDSVSRRRLVRSISATTRKPRRGERQGKDYFFIPREEFIRRRRAGEFIEWAGVLGNYYGTPRDFVESNLNKGRDVLLSIDVQGARQIKRRIKNAVFIFIAPPSFQELARRLQKRSTESSEEIAQRLHLAQKEMEYIKEYNYIIVNDNIEEALRQLQEIVGRGKT